MVHFEGSRIAYHEQIVCSARIFVRNGKESRRHQLRADRDGQEDIDEGDVGAQGADEVVDAENAEEEKEVGVSGVPARGFETRGWVGGGLGRVEAVAIVKRLQV